MAYGENIEALKGTWDCVAEQNTDEFMKEIGVGMAARMVAKNMKPRIVISEHGGVWSFKSDNVLKKISIQFTPGVEFEDTTPDGREVTSVVRFKDGVCEQTTSNKNGKQWVVTRYINEEGQQQVDMKCGSAVAHRWFKRVE